MFNSKNPRISADILHLNAIFWFYNTQPSAYPDFFILLSIGKLCTHPNNYGTQGLTLPILIGEDSVLC